MPKCRVCQAPIEFFPVRSEMGGVDYVPVEPGTRNFHTPVCKERMSKRRAHRWDSVSKRQLQSSH